MVKALADSLAEAFAELMNRRAVRSSGATDRRNLANEALIKEKYRGIRPAPGTPPAPTTPRSAPSGTWSTWRKPPASRSPRAAPCRRAPGSAASTSPTPIPPIPVAKITRDQVEASQPKGLDPRRGREMALPEPRLRRRGGTEQQPSVRSSAVREQVCTLRTNGTELRRIPAW